MGPSPRDLKDGWTPEHLPCLLRPQAPRSLGGLPGSDADFAKDIISSSLLSSGLCDGFSVFVTSHPEQTVL